MSNTFIDGLVENDINKLLAAPKSDLHNHSTKGCRLEWLSERIGVDLPKPPQHLGGLDGMQGYFRSRIKPYCDGFDGALIRWEGAFAEAKRNNIKRLTMNFGIAEVDMLGGIEAFEKTIEGFHKQYCPDTVFEAELTYPSCCDATLEADRLSQYVSSGYFKAIDICAGENVQPFEAFLPLYRRAEDFHLTKKMHVGETGSARDVKRAVEVLGLSEVHHGIGASTSLEVMKFLADNKIQVNVCPSSNVMLGFAKDYASHPIRILVENGVKVTINTDDLLIFNSSVENEYLLLYQAGALSAQQLDDIRLAGLG